MLRKPQLVREVVALVLHASPFGNEQLALLSSLKAISALSPQLVGEAVRLVQYRGREPTAARWGGARGAEQATSSDGGLSHLGGDGSSGDDVDEDDVDAALARGQDLENILNPNPNPNPNPINRDSSPAQPES